MVQIRVTAPGSWRREPWSKGKGRIWGNEAGMAVTTLIGGGGVEGRDEKEVRIKTEDSF